jgi:hypothetical protein
MKIVRQLNERVWRDFVDNHPQGNVFHTPEMFQVFARAEEHQPTLWAAIDGGGHPLALLLPTKVTVLDGLFKQMTTRSIVYGGVLCEPSLDGQSALEHLLTVYNQENRQDSLFTEVRNLSDTEPFQSTLRQLGYTYEPYENFLVNLSLPVEEVWHNIKKSARKKIRRALRKDQLAIEEVCDRQQVSAWYSLLQKTYARIQVPLADLSLFQAAFDILYPQGMAQFLLGRVDDTYVASSVALLYKNVIYGWYRGFDRQYSSYLPNDLMVWHALQWGAINGYRVFDFGGAGKPGENYGPRRFKAKFGGDLVEFGRNTYVHSKLRLQLSQIGYSLYRKFL